MCTFPLLLLSTLSLLLLLTSSSSLFLQVAANANGADSASCGTGSASGYPDHGASWQTSAAPYSLTAAGLATTYSPGVPIVLTLQSTTSATFAGFMLHAYDSNDATFKTRLGSFVATGATKASTVHTVCTGGTALTHSSSTAKTVVTVSYTPPATGPQSLVIYATVVKSLTIFWKISLTLRQASQGATPENPSGLFVSESVIDAVTGKDTLTMQFTSPSTQVNLDYYIIESSTTGAGALADVKHIPVVASQTSYTFSLTNLTATTQYTFRVRSHNQAGVSGATTVGTNSISIKTGSKTGVKPSTPTIGTPSPLSQPSPGVISLNLASFISQQPATVGLLGFDIQYHTATAGVYGNPVTYIRANQSTVVNITDLTADTYMFHIRAYGTSGTSAYSADFSTAISSLCQNDCGGVSRGVCMTKDRVCNCNAGWVGFDCSIPAMLSTTSSTDKGKCFGSGCSWRMDYGLIGNISAPTHIMFRITLKSPGYNGMLFDAPDGMSGGTGYYTDYQGAPGQVSLQTIYSPKKDNPESATTPDTFAMSHIQAWQEDDGVTTEYLFMKDIGSAATAPVIGYSTDITQTQYVGWAWGESSARTQHSMAACGRFTIQWSTGEVVITKDVDIVKAYAPMIVCLLVILVGGVLLRLSPVQHSSFGNILFQKQFNTPKGSKVIPGWVHTMMLDTLATISDFLVVEVAVILLYLLCFIIFIIVGGKAWSDVGKQSDLVWGHAAAIHWTLVLFPVNKNSILNFILGTTFERMIKYHRFLARLALGYTYVHAITQLCDLGWVIITDRPGIRWGLYSLIAFTITIGVAFEPIRRKYWNIFLLTHIVFAPLGILFAILHVNYMLYYMPLPVVLWLGDVVLRAVVRPSLLYTTTVSSALVLSDNGKTSTQATYGMVSKLTLDVQGFTKAGSFEPGSYCFINIPHISLTQWHPFSISSYPVIEGSSASASTRLTFHIMNSGRNWTHALTQHLVNNNIQSTSLAVKVDGPYGRLQLDLARYKTLILVGGGIGITPLLSILDYLSQKLSSSDPHYSSLTTIHLIWSSQKRIAFTLYAPELMQRLKEGKMEKVVKMYLYSTQRGGVESTTINSGGSSAQRDGVEMTSIQPTSGDMSPEHTVAVTTPYSPSGGGNYEESGGKYSFPDSSSAAAITHGRPPLSTLFNNIAQSLISPSYRSSGSGGDVESGTTPTAGTTAVYTPSSVGVLSCGPPTMVDEAQHLARLHGFHWHRETFRL